VGLSMGERRAVTTEVARRYRKASKGEQGRMLDELSALTGWSRRQARRALHQAVSGVPPPSRRLPRRAEVYGKDLQEPLVKVWATLGGICGKRLAPFTAEVVSALERFGELDLTDHQREQLIAMSAATIDRRLASERAPLRVKGRSGTKPGTMLKGRIPIKTFSEWDDARAGLLSGGPGGPRGRGSPGRLLPDPEPHRRGHGVDRAGFGQEQGPGVGVRGAQANPRPVALRPAGTGLRQRFGVHQRPPPALLRATGDHLHSGAGPTARTTPATSGRRTGR